MSQFREVLSGRSRARLIDELMDSYVAWREQCVAVNDTYERWMLGPRSERRLAFEAYKMALDLEEHASGIYAKRVRRFERTHTARLRTPSGEIAFSHEQPAAGWA
jgi:hypothetical protein